MKFTNHTGSISHHITPLVINALGGGGYIQTYTCKHTDVMDYKRVISFCVLTLLVSSFNVFNINYVVVFAITPIHS